MVTSSDPPSWEARRFGFAVPPPSQPPGWTATTPNLANGNLGGTSPRRDSLSRAGCLFSPNDDSWGFWKMILFWGGLFNRLPAKFVLRQSILLQLFQFPTSRQEGPRGPSVSLLLEKATIQTLWVKKKPSDSACQDGNGQNVLNIAKKMGNFWEGLGYPCFVGKIFP